MKLYRSAIIRAVVPLLLLCALGLMMLYDGARQRMRIPELFQYLPGSAPGFIYVPSLEQAWHGLTPHLDNVFGSSDTEIAKMVTELRRNLADACLFPDIPEDLEKYGLDPGGEMIVAASFPWEKGDLMMVLPVRDRNLFVSFFASIIQNNSRVELSAPANDSALQNKVKTFRLRRVAVPEYGRLCSRLAMVGSEVQAIHASKKGTARLTFVPNWLQQGRLLLQCTAIYDNGSEKPCSCKLSGGDLFQGGEVIDCASEIAIQPDKKIINELTPHPINIADKSVLGITTSENSNTLVFPQQDVALFASHPEVLSPVLDTPAATLNVHRNSNRLIQAFSTEEGAGKVIEFLLYGGARLPGILGAQAMTFRAQGDATHLKFDINADISRPQTGVVARLIASSGQTSEGVTVTEASQASLLLNESHVSYFVEYLNKYVEGFYDGTREHIGNFAIVLRELEQMADIDGIGLHLLGLREGFPELMLEVHFSDAAEVQGAIELDRTSALNLIRRVQEKLRLVRDREILESALFNQKSDLKAPPVSIKELLQRPGAEILEEPDSTWLLYSLNYGVISDPKQGLPLELFTGAQYQEDSAGMMFHYLLPPVTENDFVHRFEEEFDEADKEKLKNNSNRLCATFQDDTRQLLIGTDAELLRTILSSGLHQSEAKLYTDLRLVSDGLQPKLAIFLRPDWLVDQGAVHPDKELKELSRLWLRDFSQYDVILFTLEARKDNDGITAVIEFHRQ